MRLYSKLENLNLAVISKDNASHYKWGSNCDGWHLAKSERLSVIQERVPPGAGEVRHFHENAEQFFFVISGIATIEVDGVIHQLNNQEGIHVPAGAKHELRNESEIDLSFLVISTPPSHGDRMLVG